MGHLGHLPAPMLRQAGFVPLEPGRILDRLLKRWLCGAHYFLLLAILTMTSLAPFRIFPVKSNPYHLYLVYSAFGASLAHSSYGSWYTIPNALEMRHSGHN